MRKLAPFLAVAALLSLSPFLPAPVGPVDAQALDLPALQDGGSVVTFTDGGQMVTLDTGRKNGWHMVIRCENQNVRYLMCESNVCSANNTNCPLDSNITYDIPVPNGYPWLSIYSDDAGIPRCLVLYSIPE